MIGLARRILDSMFLQLKDKLTHEVLVTFMAEVTAIINARPLVPVTTDPDESFILTPSVLLTQKVNSVAAPAGEFGAADLYKCQWASSTPFQHILGQMAEAIPTNPTGTQKMAVRPSKVLSSSRTAKYHVMNGLLDW